MTNNDAFIKEFMQHRSRVMGYILAVTGDYHLAEDVFQEVSVVAFRKQADFKPGTNFGAWVREIARRKLIEERRRMRRSELPLDDAGLRNLEQVHQVGVDTDDNWEAEKDALRLCLSKLSRAGRTLIDQRYQAGWSLEQIAHRTRATAGAVQVTLSRMRKALKDCIARRLANGGV